MNEIFEWSAVALAARVRARAVSAVEVVQATLDRIAALNPRLNAICTLAADQAFSAARDLDGRLGRGDDGGALAGVPVGIKDVIQTGGIRTTYGSPLFKDFVPDSDAITVARLKQAGAIVIGKTNTPEFAAGASTFNALFGATRNPWNPDYSPGGSTGGGAAGLASRMIWLAEGTDLGGSLRVPAAFCGVVGLRPTPGRVPAVPVPVADDPWQVNGPMARSALDVAAMLDALSGFSADYPLSVPSAPVFAEVQAYDVPGRRFGYCPDVARIGVDPEIERLCQAAVRDLEHAGAIVEPIDLDLSPGREAFLAMRGLWVVGQQYERLDDLSVFGVNVANNIRLGLGITVKDLARADHVRGENWRRLSAILRTHDALLTPCVPVEPFPADRNYPTEIAGKPMSTYIDWIAPTFLFSMMGVPAASVPAGLSKAGLPVGLQIIGPRFHEGRVLGVAHAVERLRPIGRPALAA
jgi:amidase